MIEELNNAVDEMEQEEYPISCETCGEPIFNQDDDFNGMCEECYNTPLSNL